MARNEQGQPFSFGPGPEAGVRRGRRAPRWLWGLLAALVAGGAGAAYVWFVDRDLPRRLVAGTPLQLPAGTTTAYKWRDARGNWQITDSPPPAGTAYQTLEVSGDINIVPSLQGDGN